MDRIDLYYEVTRDKLLSQESLNKEFGAKASNLLGFGAAMIGAGVIILNLSGAKLGPDVPAFWVSIVLVLAFVSTALFGLNVLWNRPWEHSPTASGFAKHLHGYQSNTLTEWVGDEYARSVDHNKGALIQKATALQWGVTSLTLEALLVAVLGILCCWPS